MRDYRDIPLWENVTPAEWSDWRWQMAHRVTTAAALSQVIRLTSDEEEGVKACLTRFRMAVTPYFATLMNPDDPTCPIRRQMVPTRTELAGKKWDLTDPLYEELDSPVPGLVHRYPDRVLFLVTKACACYCRHCTRRRLAGMEDIPPLPSDMEAAFRYIASNDAVRDVLLSGGDPLSLPDESLDEILGRLRAIAHVEVIRIGTRMPVVLPQRVTPSLCSILKRHKPVWLNTQFNHPFEITAEAATACEMLVDSGVPVGNQSVLLRGVNDCAHIMRRLVIDLVRIRVRPYYIYQCDLSEGIDHFRTSVAKGVEIMELLRGYVSGFAVPTYVVDAPGGGGKVPIGPSYLISMSERKALVRNFEGIISAYTEPEDKSSPCHRCGICGPWRSRQPKGLEELVLGSAVSVEPQTLARDGRTARGDGGGPGGGESIPDTLSTDPFALAGRLRP